MRYLLDVNVLIALGHTGHALHSQAVEWYTSIAKARARLHTCAITELGFVRVSVVTGLQPDISSARLSLDALKSSSDVKFELVADDLGADHLPAFVKSPHSITDGHLIELAKRHGMKLVTLDRRIPGAALIA